MNKEGKLHKLFSLLCFSLLSNVRITIILTSRYNDKRADGMPFDRIGGACKNNPMANRIINGDNNLVSVELEGLPTGKP